MTTDCNRSDAELQRARALTHFVETAPIGLHWIGADGIIQWANEAQLQMLGCTREQFVGRHIAEFHATPKIISEMLPRLHRVEQIRDCETKMKCADGSIKTVLIDATAFHREGRFIHAQCVTRDITEQKKAVAALRDSERRFRALANAVPSMAWSASPDGTITWASDQWYEYTGLTPEKNATDWLRLVLHAEDYDRAVRQWRTALDQGTEFAIEVRNRRHDGEYRWFLTRAVPERDESGRV